MANGEPAGGDAGLPKHTTPTWEVELLISGVAVFAMLQLPGWLDGRMFAFAPRLDATWGGLLLILYLYAKSAALILCATFVLHLLLRARWIALVGMHSVYPDGIAWDRLRIGPVQRRIEKTRDRGSDAAIEAADNGATTIFAIGVMLAIMIAFIAGAIAISVFTLVVAARGLGVQLDPYVTLLVLVALLMLPFSASVLVDRKWGARMAPGGLPERLLAATLRFYAHIGMGRGRNRIVALLASHRGDRQVTLLTVAIMMVAVFAAMGWYSASKDPGHFGSYALFPAAGADDAVVDAGHYDDQRNPDRDPASPYIQSMVATGPYLRLVVPYQPRRDAPALLRACPAAKAGGAPAAMLPCLQGLHAASLDGKPLPASLYALGSDPRTDRPALVAMIDVRDLARGRHELRIAQPPRSRGNDERGAAEARPGDDAVRIAFWR